MAKFELQTPPYALVSPAGLVSPFVKKKSMPQICEEAFLLM
jgi:hypothetical protein